MTRVFIPTVTRILPRVLEDSISSLHLKQRDGAAQGQRWTKRHLHALSILANCPIAHIPQATVSEEGILVTFKLNTIPAFETLNAFVSLRDALQLPTEVEVCEEVELDVLLESVRALNYMTEDNCALRFALPGKLDMVEVLSSAKTGDRYYTSEVGRMVMPEVVMDSSDFWRTCMQQAQTLHTLTMSYVKTERLNYIDLPTTTIH